MRRFSVAWAMRPKPRKPAVRVGARILVLSWGPVKANGANLKLGHWVGADPRQGLITGEEGTGETVLWAYLPLFD
jgi:hypothetical protein